MSPLLEAYKVGLEVGDLEFAGYLFVIMYTLQSFHCGKEISNLFLCEMETYDKVLDSLNQSEIALS